MCVITRINIPEVLSITKQKCNNNISFEICYNAASMQTGALYI